MADKDMDFEVTDTPVEGKSKTKESGRPVSGGKLILIVLGLMAMLGLQHCSESGDVDTRTSKGVDFAAAEEAEVRDAAAIAEVDKRFQVSDVTDNGAIIQLEQQIESNRAASLRFQESMEQRWVDNEKINAKLQAEIAESNQLIVDFLDDKNYARSLKRRRGEAPFSEELPYLSNQGIEDGGEEDIPAPEELFPYEQLQGSRLLSVPDSEDVTDFVTDPFEAVARQPERPEETGNDVADGAIAVITEPEEAQPSNIVEGKVPAYSLADVTTLHGASCPTASNADVIDDVFEGKGRPVTIPIKGVFKGPNGSTRDLKGAHLFGYCFGVEGKRPTAIIRTEFMSYIDPDGEPQKTEALGYVSDARDDRVGVAGVLENTEVKNLIMASAAAGLSGFASTIGQENFDTSLTENGTVLSSLRDGRGEAAAVSGFLSSGFNKTSELISKYAERTISVVHIPANAPMIYHTLDEIKYLTADEGTTYEAIYDEPLL